MIAHIYPSVLQAVSGRGYAGCLDGCFQGYRGEAIQDLGYELPRIPIPRTPVNKGEVGESGPLSPAPTYTLPQQERHQEGNDDERNPDCTSPRPRARRHSLTL